MAALPLTPPKKSSSAKPSPAPKKLVMKRTFSLADDDDDGGSSALGGSGLGGSGLGSSGLLDESGGGASSVGGAEGLLSGSRRTASVGGERFFATDEESAATKLRNRESMRGVDVRGLDAGWTERYLRALAQPTATAQQRLARAVELRSLYVDFSARAVAIARTLVREMHRPPSNQTYRPVNIGGIAGGEKFIVNGLYFKFARDWCGVYGSDAVAMKAAGHELLSAKTVMQQNCAQISLPMMAVIDFFGHRITVMSLLPITNDTLVYGSSDACQTVTRKDDTFNGLVLDLAKQLNLKEHVVGKERVKVSTPGDLEGHLGLDGHYYLIDAARLMPPEAPVKSAIFIPSNEALPAHDVRVRDLSVLDDSDRWARQLERLLGEDSQSENILRVETPLGTIWYQHASEEENRRASYLIGKKVRGNAVLVRRNQASTLHRLLRPEFVKHSPQALCSDAWTRFVENDPDKETHNREISDATSRLFEEAIPNFAEALNRHIETPVTFGDLARMMHHRGINIRHLGRVRKLVTEPHLRSFILTDLVARVVKDDLRGRLRALNKLPPEFVAKEVVSFFNLIIGTSNRSERYWQLNLTVRIQQKYVEALSEEEEKTEYDIRHDLLMFPLLEHICQATGVSFKRATMRRLFEHQFLFTRPRPLQDDDFLEIEPITKSAFAYSETLPKLIRAAVKEDEVATKALIEQVGDIQAKKALGTLLQMKVHRLTGQIYGTESAEYVESSFTLAAKHMKSSNYTAAIDFAINGLASAEVILGLFSEAVVNGNVLLGNIYAKKTRLVEAIKYYRVALTSLERKYREHPLIGSLCAKIYFCAQQLKRSADSDQIAEAAIAADTSVYLKKAFAAFSDMFGATAGLIVLPLLGLDNSDRAFTTSVQDFAQTAESGRSFLDDAGMLWPSKTLRMVNELAAQMQREDGSAPPEPEAVLEFLSSVTADTLRHCGVESEQEIVKVLDALSSASDVASRAKQRMRQSQIAQSQQSLSASTQTLSGSTAPKPKPIATPPSLLASSPSRTTPTPSPTITPVTPKPAVAAAVKEADGYYNPSQQQQQQQQQQPAAPSPQQAELRDMSPPPAASSYTTPL